MRERDNRKRSREIILEVYTHSFLVYNLAFFSAGGVSQRSWVSSSSRRKGATKGLDIAADVIVVVVVGGNGIDSDGAD